MISSRIAVWAGRGELYGKTKKVPSTFTEKTKKRGLTGDFKVLSAVKARKGIWKKAGVCKSRQVRGEADSFGDNTIYTVNCFIFLIFFPVLR